MATSQYSVFYDTCLIIKFIQMARESIIRDFIEQKDQEPFIIDEIKIELENFFDINRRKDEVKLNLAAWENLESDFFEDYIIDPDDFSEIAINSLTLAKQMSQDAYNERSNKYNRENLNKSRSNLGEATIITIANYNKSKHGIEACIATDDYRALFMAQMDGLDTITVKQMIESSIKTEVEINDIMNNLPTKLATSEGLAKAEDKYNRTRAIESV